MTVPAVPVKVGLLIVPAGVPVTEISASVPVNVSCEIVPLGVKLPVDVSVLPMNLSSAPVPVKVGWEAVFVLTLVAID